MISEYRPNAALRFLEMTTPATSGEVTGNFRDTLVISELRGTYPNVPIAAGVDYDALIAGDPHPTFLTLPIGKAGVTSGNNRHYDEAFLQELERQTLTLKPVGLMGHLPANERSTAFPTEAIYWVGAMREGDLLWGKGYVPPGPVRERISRYKAQGKTLATSIDATAQGAWDESLKAFRMQANTLKLGQIDLAPADRAGIPDLAAIPHLTNEMADEQAQPTPADQTAGAGGGGKIEEESMPEKTKLEIITELEPADARLLPTQVRDAVIAAAPVAPEIAQVQEIRTLLGGDDKTDVVAGVRTLQTTVTEQRKAAVTARIRELVEDKDKGIKVTAVRGLVSELVAARNPQTVAEAESAYAAVVALPAVTEALAITVQSSMGPNQRNPVTTQNGAAHYFPIPDGDKERV